MAFVTGNRTLVLLFAILADLAFFAASSAFGQDATMSGPGKRVALVIGNGAYSLSPLPAATGDAKRVAQLLRDGGFDVVYAEDTKRADMEAAIKRFSQKLGRGDTVLVYFAGHAVQSQDRNFLVPVDASVSSDADISSQAVDTDLILDPLIVDRPKGAAIILDAARKNDWQQKGSTRAAGLANLRPIHGITQAYSAAPGEIVDDQTGSQGLFVSEFLKAAKVPGRTFKDAFRLTRTGVAKATRNKQVPWETSIDTADFVVMPQGGSNSLALRGPTHSPDSLEQGFWDTIKSSDSAANFQAYIDAYPNGAFVSAARERLQALVPNTPSKPQATAERAPSSTLQDCAECPELVLIQPGTFAMGSTEIPFEGPIHDVSIRNPFYIGRYEVTYAEWDACLVDKGCTYRPDDRGLGRGRRPVTNVDWNDAKAYIGWLSRKTGKTYRLPTESEWEYAARASTTSPYFWGRTIEKDHANCWGCTTEPRKSTIEVGSFKPNSFGVYDMAGNAAEWVEDCWSEGYRGAPSDGSAFVKSGCSERVLRGGAFNNDPKYVRSAARFKYDYDVRYPSNGFRVVREQ
ncbi:SUMF1/EgtB/PvdO family nonheme iron enzyme [Bradyrhizobium sp. STM 3843]|uniref:SUMF1/EgtB/PvdO family nonheme iron enzyme n=1 Tax=Bradyrhizobium sp. STM 3843 TaxID=551947 RepID=UPI0002F5BF05|nr:SUMF1/EgtB/PvdO family nonheme iron enzyme [Bradyrhizobium sp. STM 3843]